MVTSPKLDGERKPTSTYVLRQPWLECLAMSYLTQGRQRLLERRKMAPQQKPGLWRANSKKAFKFHRWAIAQHQEYRAKGLVSRAGTGPRLWLPTFRLLSLVRIWLGYGLDLEVRSGLRFWLDLLLFGRVPWGKCLMLSNLRVRFPVHLRVWIGVHEECEVFSSSVISCFQEDVLLALLHKFPGDGLSFNFAECFRERLDTLGLQKVHVGAESSTSSYRKAKMWNWC